MYCMKIPFSAINNISISLNNSNSTLVFFKHGCYANLGADHLLRKLSNTSANNNVSL